MSMERIYIDGDTAKFTRTDITTVDMVLYDGRYFEDLEPRRLFPMTGVSRYITLLDKDGNEVAVIRNLATLDETGREIISSCLEEYYHIPKIQRILNTEEKFGIVKFFCETDRGECVIEIRNTIQQIKLTFGIRVLFRDNDDNRYEIPDINKVDGKTRQTINFYL